jgi:hypothetical protein
MPYSARRVLVLSPFAGMVLAWLGVTGVRDGLGPVHFVLTGAAGGAARAAARPLAHAPGSARPS